MEEKESRKNLKKLTALFFSFLIIGALCIGSVFYILYERRKNALNSSESVSAGMEKEEAYIAEVYTDENNTSESDRVVTIYKIIVMTGIFFLVIAFGYILPGIIKVRKDLNNES